MIVAGGIAFGAALMSYLLNWGVLGVLRRWGVMDVPNARSSHNQPTPRGGGIGIVLTFGAGAAWFALLHRDAMAGLVACAVLALAVLSFLDDKLNLSWRLRLGGHLAVAVACAIGLRPEAGMLGWLAVPVLVLLLAGHANAFNFMDGINGIAGGQTVVAGVALAALASGMGGAHPVGWLALLLAGAAAGFLPHNFPRARMFMGDVGSVPIGFGLMLLSAWLAHDRGIELWVPMLAIHSGFIMDTGFTFWRRWRRGERLHEAHREHFYQRLIRAGWSHTSVSGLFLMVSSIVSGTAIVLAMRGASWEPVAGLCALAWGGYFSICEFCFRKMNPV